MNEPTTPANWTHALRRQLDALGLDSNALCAACGVDLARLEDPEARYPLLAMMQLWQLAAQASGDPAIGLRVARFVSPATFYALGYALVASDNLREVFERIARHHELVRDSLSPSLYRHEDRYTLCLQPRDGVTVVAPEVIDAFISVFVRTCRNRLGRHYAPLAVSLMRPPPMDPTPWHNVLRAPVEFGAKQNSLDFALADFECHLDDADHDAGQYDEDPQEPNQGMLQPLAWEGRVRSSIEALLPGGVPTAEQVASNLNMNLLSLERRLADEGCRYDSLLDECRQNLALNYLREPDTPLGEIGRRLGFADSKSFNRAFRRWTGVSAGQFRAGLYS